MWVAPGEDPRPTGTVDGELATIRQYLTHFRLTLGMKCDGLDARQLAARSVPPSTMTFTTWKAQTAAADEWLDEATDLGAPARMPDGDEAPVRDILIHMIEEYARHCGHADLLRECIGGRTGQ